MLSDFYRSKAWTELMQVIKLDRLHDDGLIYCEHCGKPIVKAYDCIGHHVIELTEDNYQDASISLNPDNISLVHHRCHNKIHNKLGYAQREVFLVYGSPLSGKSTWVDSVRNDGDLIIDMDNIWQCVSGCDRYYKPPRLNANVFAIRDELIRQVQMRVGKWQCAYLIGGFPLSNERERLCRQLGAREVFINTSKEECLARAENLTDGRDKDDWQDYILIWHEKYMPAIK